MVAITQDEEKLLTADSIISNCSDAVGDDDNCCEFGCDYKPIFNTITIQEIFDVA